MTRHHIPEERIFQPSRREKFKTCTHVLDRKLEEKRAFDRPGLKVRMTLKMTLKEQNLRP